MKISKNSIKKLIEYSDLNLITSSDEMQYNLEAIYEILEKEFPDLVSEYILNN